MAGSENKGIGIGLLLLKVAGMAAAIAASYILLLYVALGTSRTSLMATTFDKMRLLKDAPSPKIVFVGGSNLAFGLDSARVREALAMPVVNMGLQAGVGLKYMLDEVEPYLKKGDVVVVVPEYNHFNGLSIYGEATLVEEVMLTRNWPVFTGMPVRTLGSILLKSNETLFRRRHALPYTRNSFNRDGDVTAHLTMPPREIEPSREPVAINREAVECLKTFATGNSRRGGTTLLVFPCLQRSHYERNAASIGLVAATLESLGAFAAISKPEDFVYDDNLFFDTIYHPNALGRELRTEKLISVLQASRQKFGW